MKDYQKFSEARSVVKKLMKRDRDLYFVSLANSVRADNKVFWKFAKSRYREAHFDVALKILNEIITDKEIITGNFVELFGAVTSNKLIETGLNLVQHTSCYDMSDKLCLPVISSSDVMLAAKGLLPKKSAGIDGIPPFLIKGCVTFLLVPLCHIFNLSLGCGVFPTAWKEAIVTPIFKSGSRLLV